MIKFECRRCYGRRIVDNVPCYLCHGKGEIELSQDELEEYFLGHKEKAENREDKQ